MLFFRRQSIPGPEEHSGREPAPDTFLPPAQAAGQSDDDYRLALVDQLAAIDKTKRDIKGQIHSAAITAKAERVSVDQVWLRRAKDKIDHLTREREEVRKALHTVNERIKNGHRQHNRPKDTPVLDLDAAFRQVAKERLPLDLYDELADEAEKRMKVDESRGDVHDRSG